MVERDTDRDAYVLKYDNSVVQGDTADLKNTNTEGGDVSERKGFVNDGRVIVNVPAGSTVTFDAVITGSDGGEDTGTVTVGPEAAPAE